jgi:hypothetical protein
MLVHHGSMKYEEAASEAGRIARQKLEAEIENGRLNASRIVERVMTEVPLDNVVVGRALSFDGDEEFRDAGSPGGLLTRFGDYSNTLSKHAAGQMCTKVGMPSRYLSWLSEHERRSWGLPLAAQNFNTIFSNDKGRYLLRSYNDELRGFLSDRYRRRDSRPLMEGFIGACNEVGAIPISGIGSNVKVALKAVLPRVFEPVPNEPMSIGVMWENSDYGAAKHRLWVFITRLWCTNHALMTSGFAQVHLGKKLEDNPMLSERTIELDNRTTISAMQDIIGQTMSPDAVETLCQVVRDANDQKIDAQKAIKSMSRKFSKAEQESIVEKFNTPDVEQLPPGNTVWRFSNAMSWLANETEDPDRKVELMKLAGEVLPDKR